MKLLTKALKMTGAVAMIILAVALVSGAVLVGGYMAQIDAAVAKHDRS